jgi:non-lysosomal glucosylceramidase
MKNQRDATHPCGCSSGCRPALPRRDFVKLVGLTGAGALFARLPAMAGPFERADFDKLVPADKKLSPEWVKSLFERGAPEVVRGEDLKWIGMPVGGLCAGQLYLGGDGKLWHWDIFNRHIGTGAEHYAHPMQPGAPLEQGFALKIGETTRPLDRTGFSDVAFRGEYPIATVDYKDAGVPVEVRLEAFSPFIPLNTDESSLPATVMTFTVRNSSKAAVEAVLAGSIENAVCLNHRTQPGVRRNRIVRGEGFTFLEGSAAKDAVPEARQPDILFEDWNKETYDGWTAEGTAFGAGPIRKSAIPDYQGDVGGDTERVVNSHATAPGAEVGARDSATGKLISRTFTIERGFISFWIGGGGHAGKTCLNLVVDGQAARTATGQNNNRMAMQSFDVRELKGKEARIEIVDAESGGWGNTGVGRITFGDLPAGTGDLESEADFGTMGLALLGAPADVAGEEASAPLPEKLAGHLGRALKLAPGKSATVTFVVAWHFPNLEMGGMGRVGRHYAARFASALDVVSHVAAHHDRLASDTRLWRDTWYDSTLPYWFLDRTMLNTSILATSTCFRFHKGRFYAWEGVGCCAGTCGHVWQYAHAPARLFPELERDLRERMDFGMALRPDGAIIFRGEHSNIPAIDAQAGSILRAYREHQMSPNGEFLQRIWPGVQRAMNWLIAKDGNEDGLIEDNQHNTLDTDWFGPVAWLSGLYQAALRAAEEMATELGDAAYATRCRAIREKGAGNLVAQLFDGEYFINKPDPKRPDTINSGTGCEIDQVMGQSWAWQVGLGRVLPEKETRSALKSLWRYNFTPDVGPYRERYKPGRWYAMAGEAGLLMCSFPRSDWDYEQAKGKGADWAAGYFNECMNGFEYQAAGHMIWEGLVQEGLAVTRAVHDRYAPSRRNPYNEVECGDHYARSMASYGVFLAACGFEYHGPKGHIGFAPRLTPQNFKAAFTAAEGWGTFHQKAEGARLRAEIAVKRGQVRLATVALAATGKKARVTLGGRSVPATVRQEGGRALVVLGAETTVGDGQVLRIEIT